MNQLCTSVILKIIIGTQTAFYNKRTLIHLTGPICKTYFYILIALVLKADILDCYIPRSFFLASLILSECFGSQKYLSAVLVLTFDTIHIQVYS